MALPSFLRNTQCYRHAHVHLCLQGGQGQLPANTHSIPLELVWPGAWSTLCFACLQRPPVPAVAPSMQAVQVSTIQAIHTARWCSSPFHPCVLAEGVPCVWLRHRHGGLRVRCQLVPHPVSGGRPAGQQSPAVRLWVRRGQVSGSTCVHTHTRTYTHAQACTRVSIHRHTGMCARPYKQTHRHGWTRVNTQKRTLPARSQGTLQCSAPPHPKCPWVRQRPDASHGQAMAAGEAVPAWHVQAAHAQPLYPQLPTSSHAHTLDGTCSVVGHACWVYGWVACGCELSELNVQKAEVIRRHTPIHIQYMQEVWVFGWVACGCELSELNVQKAEVIHRHTPIHIQYMQKVWVFGWVACGCELSKLKVQKAEVHRPLQRSPCATQRRGAPSALTFLSSSSIIITHQGDKASIITRQRVTRLPA